ncbi:glycoside hydrolase superfamily [Zopfochytrium polystomum]|nr:glycoside hydrolase superfamily [Zopfochytrium polystomum]
MTTASTAAAAAAASTTTSLSSSWPSSRNSSPSSSSSTATTRHLRRRRPDALLRRRGVTTAIALSAAAAAAVALLVLSCGSAPVSAQFPRTTSTSTTSSSSSSSSSSTSSTAAPSPSSSAGLPVSTGGGDTPATTDSPAPAATPGVGGGSLGSTGLPAQGQFVLGAWLNYEEYPDSLDTPAKFNQRLGYKAGSFQVRQSIPPIINDDGTNHTVTADVLDDDTNASIFFTIYADQTRNGLEGLQAVTQADLTALAQQLANLQRDTGRAILVRYLPEMNGPWMLYGGQPTAFVANWRQMATTMRSIAPDVKLVWSPNFDLNNRGDNTGGQPYWPGAQYVDYVGTSQYWKSSQSVINSGGVLTGNYAPSANYFADSISYVYNTYAVPNNKLFVVSEASAAWETASTIVNNQVTQPEMQYDFWSQVFTSFSSGQFPLMVMAHIFEYTKPEDGYQRDFRVTWNTATRDRFLAALQPLISTNKVVWATGGKPLTTSSSSSSSTTSHNTTSATVSSKSTTSAATHKAAFPPLSSVVVVAAAVSSVAASVLLLVL